MYSGFRCFIILFFIYSPLKGQINSVAKYDSLYTTLESKNDKQQLSTLIKLASYQKEKNPDIALNLLERALLLTKKLDTPKEEAEVIRLQGVSFDTKKLYKKALKLYFSSLEKARRIGDSLLVAKAIHNIAFTYYHKEEYDKSIQYHLTNIAVENSINDEEGLGYTYNHLGLIYDTIERYSKADSCYHLALSIREKINHLAGIGYTCLNLSSSHTRRGEYDLGVKYINRSLETFEQLGDTSQYANALNKKGNILWYQEEYEASKVFYEKALSLYLSKENWVGVIDEYINMGLVESNLNKLPEAKVYYMKALKVAEERENIPLKNWISIYDKLYRVTYFKGEYKEAFSHLGDYFIYKEKLAKKTSQERIIDLESKYELEKKEAEVEFLNQENKMLKMEKAFNNHIAILTVLILLIVIAFYFYLNRVKHRQNEIIKEKSKNLERLNEELSANNEELDRFVYTVSHDLKSPLASAMGLIEVIRLESISPIIEDYLKLQENKLNNLSQFINELLEYSKISKKDILLEKVNFSDLIEDILNKLSHDFDSKLVAKEVVIELNYDFESDVKLLKSILQNLITNSIRYRNQHIDNSFVKITVNSTSQNVIIAIEDNGLGIEELHLKRIFEKFYRANNTVKGTGLGLAIVKESIERLNGKIEITSKVNKGTTFKIMLPNN